MGVACYRYAEDPLFWQRYAGLVSAKLSGKSRGAWYSPTEDIPGARAPRPPGLPGSSGALPEQRLDAAEAYVSGRNTSSLLVWHRGRLVRERYFEGFDAASPIVSRSMAKPLASILVARAIQQGHIESLSQPVADFIPAWRGTPKEAITLRHVLNMSSGLWRFYRDTLNPFSFFHRGFLSGHHEQILIDEVPLVDTPGTVYDYSQITSDLVAMVIERATGQRYARYLSQALLQPMQLAGGELWLNRPEGVAHSGCCIMLPARTWLALGILVARNGVWQGQRLLPDWWRREVLESEGVNPNYSLGFWLGSPHQARRQFINPAQYPRPGVLQSQPYAAGDLLMFDGNGSQVLYIVPSRELVILRTGGRPGPDGQGMEWDNTYLPNTLLEGLPGAAVKDSDDVTSRTPFDQALQRLAPLGRVLGALREPLPAPTEPAGARFKDALAYARDMDSYALLVWHRGRLVLEHYFDVRDASLRPESASMHKTVLALLVAAALEDGYLDSVDDPVGRYLPAWRGRPEGAITVAQLLTMTSGLEPLSLAGGSESDSRRFYRDGREARALLLGMELTEKPGAHFRYANTNSQLLGLVLEAATGKPYRDYLQQRLWQPLGADDAYVWYNEAAGFPRTYTALLARPRDWLRVGRLIKDRGLIDGRQVIDASWVDHLCAPSPRNSNYGWQVWLGNRYQPRRYYNDSQTGPFFAAREPFLVDDMIYLDGFGGQRVYISRSRDLVVVRMGAPRSDWDDSVLPNRVLQALPTQQDTHPESAAATSSAPAAASTT